MSSDEHAARLREWAELLGVRVSESDARSARVEVAGPPQSSGDREA
jgi:hypothetical protein